MRKLPRLLTAAVIGIIALHTLAAIILCEIAIRLPRKPLTEKMRVRAESGALQLDAKLVGVQITSFDGARLSAWFFLPQRRSNSMVILLHGHGDNRAGMLGFVPMLLRHKYAVLVPDARAHGESGGDLQTYGMDESRDLSRWVDWLSAQDKRGCVFGLGESMGAAILLQALPNESRFCSVVAESPFASFREVAYDRLGQRLGGGAWLGRTLFGPLVSEAFLYARLRYRVDFDQASPAKAVASTRVPVLLIHGTEDYNIPLRHCEAILKNHSGVMEFWQVPGAGHTGAFGQEPEEFERRVTDWFSRYSQKDTVVFPIHP
jgi:dipeptidyl aminopeptidase/acylaminoacyl peptidase